MWADPAGLVQVICGVRMPKVGPRSFLQLPAYHKGAGGEGSQQGHPSALFYQLGVCGLHPWCGRQCERGCRLARQLAVTSPWERSNSVRSGSS